MLNVEMTVEGNLLTIKVDLSKAFGPSLSGKSMIIASTQGAVRAPGSDSTNIQVKVFRTIRKEEMTQMDSWSLWEIGGAIAATLGLAPEEMDEGS